MARAAVLLAVAAVAAVIAAGVRADVPPYTECNVSDTSSAGNVTQLVATRAWVKNRYIGSLVKLKKGDSVCTDAGGQLWWQLSGSGIKALTCNTTASTSLRVYPPAYPKQAVHFFRGVNTCTTGGAGSTQFGVGTARGPVIRVTDPVFAVEADPDQGTTVKLVLGFGEVTGASGSRSVVVVGPGQQTFVPLAGDPETPSPMTLTQPETAASDVLRKRLKPNFARPKTNDSPVLRDIFARKTIRVAIDTEGSSDQALAFVKAYFSFLASSWKITPSDPATATRDDALKALAGRQLDAFVTPADVAAQQGVTESAFVADPDSNTIWQLVLPEDATYATAMLDFLRNMLFFGRYGDLYRPEFSGEPPFDTLQPVLP